MPAIPGTILASKISPGDTTATFPTHEDIYGKGGLMCVSTVQELTSIPLDRQKIGMLLYVNSNTQHYTLTSLSYPLTSYSGWIRTIYNDITVVGNLSAQGSISASGSNIPVTVINSATTKMFSNTDSNKVFHFDTTSTSLSAQFPLTLSDGFNVAIMNTGTKYLYLSAGIPYRATGNTIVDIYAGAYVYKFNSQIFAVGSL